MGIPEEKKKRKRKGQSLTKAVMTEKFQNRNRCSDPKGPEDSSRLNQHRAAQRHNIIKLSKDKEQQEKRKKKVQKKVLKK